MSGERGVALIRKQSKPDDRKEFLEVAYGKGRQVTWIAKATAGSKGKLLYC